jgi:hypothetical protein
MEYRRLIMKYMFYLEQDIKDIKERYANFMKAGKYCGLSEDEIKESQDILVERQHQLFVEWYRLNEENKKEGRPFYTSSKIKELGSYLLRLGSYKDLILEAKKIS